MTEVDSANLIYVMGPSGAGKDSLLGFARERIGTQVMFAHRYITRVVANGENHIALHPRRIRRAAVLRPMHWDSLGLRATASASKWMRGSRAA